MTGSKTDSRACARTLLETTVKGLYGIQGEAGAAGDFELADQLNSHCSTLRAWLEDMEGPTEDAHDPLPPTMVRCTPADLGAASTVKRPVRNGRQRKKRPKPGTASFTRQGDEYLVRSGFSKKLKKEYSHRAPRALIDALGYACLVVAQGGKPSFTMNDLKGNRDLKSKGISDGYYYDVLKWFVEIGFVEKAELRGRYKLGKMCDGPEPVGDLEMEFKKLAEQYT